MTTPVLSLRLGQVKAPLAGAGHGSRGTWNAAHASDGLSQTLTFAKTRPEAVTAVAATDAVFTP